MFLHTDFRFHPRVAQIGCYFGEGGHNEVYLLEGDLVALIDTGCADAPGKYLAPALRSFGMGLENVDLIINTHSHNDHCGGNAAVVAASGAAVNMPAGEATAVADPDAQFQRYFAPDYLLTGRQHQIEAALADFKSRAAPTKVDRALSEGDVLDLGRGIELRVLLCPGHTIASTAFYWEREGILFTGDCVLGGGSRPSGFPLIFHPAEYGTTLDRLEKLDFDTICLGHHYRSLTLRKESVKHGPEAKEFLRESRAIHALIADAMSRAVSELSVASFQETVALALKTIRDSLNLDIDADTGLPTSIGAAGALDSYFKYFRHSESASR